MFQQLFDELKVLCDRGHCTCFVDNWFGSWIGGACKKHDVSYENQKESKEAADAELFWDIVRTIPWYKGNYVVATVMWLGVRAGGYIAGWNDSKK